MIKTSFEFRSIGFQTKVKFKQRIREYNDLKEALKGWKHFFLTWPIKLWDAVRSDNILFLIWEKQSWQDKNRLCYKNNDKANEKENCFLTESVRL